MIGWNFYPADDLIDHVTQNLALEHCGVWMNEILLYHDQNGTDVSFKNPNAFKHNSADGKCVPGFVRPFSDENQAFFDDALKEKVTDGQDIHFISDCAPKLKDEMAKVVAEEGLAAFALFDEFWPKGEVYTWSQDGAMTRTDGSHKFASMFPRRAFPRALGESGIPTIVSSFGYFFDGKSHFKVRSVSTS